MNFVVWSHCDNFWCQVRGWVCTDFYARWEERKEAAAVTITAVVPILFNTEPMKFKNEKENLISFGSIIS